MENDIFKKAGKSKKTFIIIISMLIFCAVLYYVFFVMAKSDSAGGTAVMPTVNSSYQEYKNYISNTNNGIKSLLEGEQLKQTTLYELPSGDNNIARNENPFVKSF